MPGSALPGVRGKLRSPFHRVQRHYYRVLPLSLWLPATVHSKSVRTTLKSFAVLVVLRRGFPSFSVGRQSRHLVGGGGTAASTGRGRQRGFQVHGAPSLTAQEGVNFQGEHRLLQTSALCPAWRMAAPGRGPGICSLCSHPPRVCLFINTAAQTTVPRNLEARLWGEGVGVKLGDGWGGERRGRRWEKTQFTPFLLNSFWCVCCSARANPQIRSPKPQLLPFAGMNGSGREGEFIF